MSEKETEKPKLTGNKAKGFASNPDKINRNGRPKGARNKSTLLKAQLSIDDMANTAVQTLNALMNNDLKFLKSKDPVPLTIRMQACKVIIDKSIVNEKNKVNEKIDKENEEKPKAVPVFSSTPIKKESNG